MSKLHTPKRTTKKYFAIYFRNTLPFYVYSTKFTFITFKYYYYCLLPLSARQILKYHIPIIFLYINSYVCQINTQVFPTFYKKIIKKCVPFYHVVRS